MELLPGGPNRQVPTTQVLLKLPPHTTVITKIQLKHVWANTGQIYCGKYPSEKNQVWWLPCRQASRSSLPCPVVLPGVLQWLMSEATPIAGPCKLGRNLAGCDRGNINQGLLFEEKNVTREGPADEKKTRNGMWGVPGAPRGRKTLTPNSEVPKINPPEKKQPRCRVPNVSPFHSASAGGRAAVQCRWQANWQFLKPRCLATLETNQQFNQQPSD